MASWYIYSHLVEANNSFKLPLLFPVIHFIVLNWILWTFLRIEGLQCRPQTWIPYIILLIMHPFASFILALYDVFLLVNLRAPSFLFKFGTIALFPTSRNSLHIRVLLKLIPKIFAQLLGDICSALLFFLLAKYIHPYSRLIVVLI